MAAILQLRRGVLTDFSDYGTNLSEPYFDTSRDTLHIGTTDGTGSSADWITLVKLSQANSGSTKDEPNTGSLWIVGDITGSDLGSGIHTTSSMYLSGNITASHAWFKNNVRIDGHLIMGDNQPDDVVTVRSDFSGNLIPDNDQFGQVSSAATDGLYDLGQDTKRWRNVYLQRDVNSGSLGGALSGSNIDLTGQIKVDELGRFGYVEVEDLVDNRLVIVGPSGRLESDSNLTYDGQDFRLTNSDYYQSGSGASFQFHGAGMNITGSVTINELAVNGGIVFTNVQGTLDNSTSFTWNDTYVGITGGVSASQDISVGNEAYLQSAIVKDLTNDRVVIAGINGELEDSVDFVFTDTELNIGEEKFTVQRSSGNTHTSGTLDVDGQSTLASVNVEDLTDNRVVIVGAGGEIEDDGNFTFNGTELNIGTGNFTIQQGSGNTQILGTLDVDSQSTLSSLNVEDLTSGRVVLAGTSGELEDSGNLTFDGSTLTVTGDTIVTGNLTIQGTQTQLNTSILNVEDKNILIASGAVNAAAADGGGITIDGADATILYSSANDSFQLNKQLQVEGNISGSSFGGTTLLSSSNENFADYSQSVDSRLVAIEGPMSTSLDSRLIEIFATGSDHETRLDELEGTFSSSVDGRLIEIFTTGSDHETRLDSLEGEFSTSVDSRITNVSASFDTTIGALTFDQLADVNDYTASLIPHGYLPVWNSGSQEWAPGKPDFEQGKTRLFVAASRSNTSAFFFNSQTRTSDTSASPVDDSAFMLISGDLDTIKVHLRCSNSVDVTVDIFKNADGTAFSGATSMVTPTTTSLTSNTISTITFTSLSINPFDSIHIKVTPSGGGDFYGIIEIV